MPNKSRAQSTSVYRKPNALRHGVYSRAAVLPGEDQAAFDRLHRGLIAEYSPSGVHEFDIIQTMANLMWRKQNLETVHKAALLRGRLLKAVNEISAARFPAQATIMTHPQSQEILELAKAQLCEEFGDVSALLEAGEAAGFASLNERLNLEERLDGLIYKCVRGLMAARGAKSVLGAPQSAAVMSIAGPPTKNETQSGTYLEIDCGEKSDARS